MHRHAKRGFSARTTEFKHFFSLALCLWHPCAGSPRSFRALYLVLQRGRRRKLRVKSVGRSSNGVRVQGVIVAGENSHIAPSNESDHPPPGCAAFSHKIPRQENGFRS
uniref:Secreted protein n=1 Tax=Trypanosoma vivax (strain Y486) TaxID=1055687 RepID=G0U3W7_TRYVY|nr:hypothetical protein TVY486_1011700 [Trypanosoma vivax Y486]